MFGCIVASRPVTTELQAISETQFAFNIPSQPAFNHIVIFLLPGQTLPDTHAASVYIQVPPSQDFRLLGAIANQKPSAIFKITSATNSVGIAAGQAGGGDDLMLDDATLQPATSTSVSSVNIVVGISIEPIAVVEQQLAQLKQKPANSELVRYNQPTNTVSTKVLAQTIIENAFNFLGSFADGPQELVSMKKFHEWWNKFEKRIDFDPSFLEKAQTG